MSASPPAGDPLGLDGIAARIPGWDHLRGSPARFGGPGDWKEWQHFLVHAPGLQLLINFNLSDAAPAGGPSPPPIARLICMARRDRWVGGADRYAPEQVRAEAGEIDLRFGDNELRWDGRAYRLRAALRDGRVAVDLRLTPASIPLLAANQPLSDARTISWFALPRLTASGVATVEGERIPLRDCAAYHDHNWGRFRWGDDFCWEWASSLPTAADSPWAVVFSRVLDRARHRARSRDLYLFRRGRLFRLFRDEEVSTRLQGRFRPPAGYLRVPPVMALLEGGTASDVPARVVVRGSKGEDHLELTFEPEDLARVLIPDETRPEGLVALNEVSGPVRVEGRVRGERADHEGVGVFEFIRG